MKVVVIARQTVMSYVRDRVFHGVLFFSLLFVSFSFLLSTLTIVESAKILVDFGLSAVSLMGVALSIFLGVTVVGREIDQRTIYTILSKPVSRTEYLVGKMLGATFVVGFVHVLGYLVLRLVIHQANEMAPSGLEAALYLMLLEAVLVVLITIFLSLWLSSLFLVGTLSVGVFLIGRSSSALNLIQEKMEPGIGKALMRVVYDFMPSLDRFNIREVAAYGKPYPEGLVLESSVYFLAYLLFLVGVSFVLFRRKDLR